MQHIGLALSGGGFRATLYHLGVVRFMRDAQLLRNVTHITSVSGGSILGAHLALNWDRYCGTSEQFETAAREVIRFVQMDIRNRIVRRVPFASALNFSKSLMWMPQTRQLTRAGLLEKQYEQFLFGDVRLSQLPDSPRLHMLATNLSEGCLCAFHRNGLTQTQRTSGKSTNQVSMGLATVPMAVAASSAFPGFFPPLELNAWETGADESTFGRQSFTDGGIYDNLGLRMFRYIEQSSDDTFHKIFVSDAGAPFKVTQDTRKGGVIRTAMRSSDILMDRVWQLESEAVNRSENVVFVPITGIVDQSVDPYAPDPEVQRQTSRIRTDLDRFSNMEVSALVQHGYCAARNSLKNPDLPSEEIPGGAPWDPFRDRDTEPLSSEDPIEQAAALTTARQLRKSSSRKVWSTLFSLRDWPSYVWISVLILLAVSLPYYAIKLNRAAQQQQNVLAGIAEMSPQFRTLLSLVQDGPRAVEAADALPFSEVESLEDPSFVGMEILTDTRIFDLRGWKNVDDETAAVAYVRLHVRRNEEGEGTAHLRLQRESTNANMTTFCDMESFNPTLSRQVTTNDDYLWEMDLDMSRVPMGGHTEVAFQRTLPSDMASQAEDQGRFNFTVRAPTSLLQVWVLLPENRQYDSFEVSGYPVGHPEQAKVVVPHSRARIALGSIATFRLINPEANYRYACRWKWATKAE